jgi:3alpha(or 20beta)-hydroxysteroid dehydrogenase
MSGIWSDPETWELRTNPTASNTVRVRGMTKVAARELGQFGIRVNSVHPGGVLTRMIIDSAGARTDGEAEAFIKAMPLARFAEPVEISRLVAYLASDESSYSTGSEFIADGGILAGPGY